MEMAGLPKVLLRMLTYLLCCHMSSDMTKETKRDTNLQKRFWAHICFLKEDQQHDKYILKLFIVLACCEQVVLLVVNES